MSMADIAKSAAVVGKLLPGSLARAVPVKSVPLDIVWHYTTVSGFLAQMEIWPNSSLTNKHFASSSFRSLWATSSQYMNDSEEFEFGRRELQRAVARSPLSSSLHRIILRCIKRSIERADASAAYCTSFSSFGDDLSQWRGYGDGGNGVSIGFDRSALETRAEGIGRWVVYDRAEQEALADDIVDAALSFVLPLIASYGGIRERIWYLRSLQPFLSEAFPALFLLFKHSAFSAEGEFRVIYTDGVSKSSALLPRFYRSRGNRLIPFVKVGLVAPPPVVSIILGPGIGSKHNELALEQMCKQVGALSVSRSRSIIPFVPG